MSDVTVLSRERVEVPGAGTFRCAVGRSGFIRDKREGDGATPVGRHRLLRLLYRPDLFPTPPITGLPCRPIAPTDGWCDDPNHPDYNQPISLPHSARHERLWRDDRVYDLILVTDQNSDPVVPGQGSAIFMHAARPDFSPTEGCVALAQADLLHVLRRLEPGSRLVVPETLAP